MKKFFVLLVLVMFAVSMFGELMQPNNNKTALVRENAKETRLVRKSVAQREVPEYEFQVDPTNLMATYYDYMPGSYNSLPVAVQPDEFGGVYMIFHARETTTVNRREYYAYVDASGAVTNVGTISTNDIWEGYGGIDTDPGNGDPIASWHWTPTGGMFEACASYDLFHFGTPGFWVENWTVIDNTNDWAPDEFIWPYVHIARSPEAGHYRVYIQGNNATSSTGGQASPSENVLLAYADFEEMDFNMQSQLDWTFTTLPVFDDWHNENPTWNRPSHGMIADPSTKKIAFMGYNQANWNDDDGNTADEEFYVYYNNDIDTEDWVYESISSRFPIFNPQNEDGSYVFMNDVDNIPWDLYLSPTNSGHLSTVYSDDCSKLTMSINMCVVTGNDSAGDSFYYPWLHAPYVVQYDFDTGEFTIITQDSFVDEDAVNQDYVHGANDLFVPWDTDNDGLIDAFSEDGNVLMYNGWPIYFYDTDTAFHENYMHITTNEENDWMVNVWSDGLKNKYYNEDGDEDYVEWANIAEIYITASNDGGASWSEPIIMNAKVGDDNYAPELQGIMPCYIYPGNEIQDLGDNWGLVHLMFLDDNGFGSYTQGFGENNGGTMMYSAVKINFGFGGSDADEPVVVVPNAQLGQNYPNPFNGNTTINFSLDEGISAGTIEIFNIKGQLVKEFSINDDNSEVIWDASNQASGIYFYKMKSGGRYTSTKKMILLK